MSTGRLRLVTAKLVCAMVLLFGAAQSYAQDAETEFMVDSISNLPAVKDISVDGDAGTVLITMPNRVVRLDTFPLRVTADVNLPDEGISSVVTKDDRLLVLAEKPDADRGTGWALIYPGFGTSLNDPITPQEVSLGKTPFSQALMSKDGVVYAVNPTSEVVVTANVDELLAAAKDPDSAPKRGLVQSLFMQCGPAGTLSILNAPTESGAQDDAKTFYIASITGAKVIEIGEEVLNQRKLSGTTCFKPGGVVRSTAKSTRSVSRKALLHEVIGNRWHGYDAEQPSQWLLTFDTDQHELMMFPIRIEEDRVAMRRSEGVRKNLIEEFEEVGLPARQFGLLAASDGVSVILVSHIGSNHVHRLKRVDNQIEYLGATQFDGPIQMLDVSPDGKLAVVLTGALRRDATTELVVIKNPGALNGVSAIPDSRFSVLALQQHLAEQGYNLRLDGKYGPQTQAALNAYFVDDNSAATETLSVEDRLRGIYPVAIFGPSR